MSDPKPPFDGRPSASTYSSAIGGMAATFLLIALKSFHVEVDPVAAASIGGGMAALAGYFFTGGKAADVE